MSRCPRFAWTMAAAAALFGCGVPGVPEPKPIPAHFGRAADIEAVRRVMVLPFDAAAGVRVDLAMVRDSFIAELAKMQRFELVPLPEGTDADDALYHSLRRGRLSTETLAALGERYNLDGILLGTVTSYRAYKPPHLGMRVQLVSLHSATAVWAVEAIYDAADAASLEDIQHYAQSFLAEEDALHGWEMLLISPTSFASFVSHRVVGTWRAAPWW